MILDSYIDNYIGEWNDESGKRLSIKKAGIKSQEKSVQSHG